MKYRKTTLLGTCDLNWNTLTTLRKQLDYDYVKFLHEEIIFSCIGKFKAVEYEPIL